MNHLRKFELETDYLQAKDSFVYPNVSYIVEKDILHYMKNSKYEFVDLGLPSGLNGMLVQQNQRKVDCTLLGEKIKDMLLHVEKL